MSENDTQVVNATDRSGEAICEMLPTSLKVEDWTGTLTMVSTASLSEGQTVKFSGPFQKGDYCIDEDSMLSENGLRTPTFNFSFTSIGAN